MRILFTVIFALALMLAGCFQTEYTLQRNATTPVRMTPAPQTVMHTPSQSRFGWVAYEQSGLTPEGFGGGYVRQYPGSFLWQRVEVKPGLYDFSQTDAAVKRAQNMGKTLVPIIWPLSRLDQDGCRKQLVESCEVSKSDLMLKRGKENFLPSDRCMPCNITNYELFVIQVVERYDGDGNDDMPGLQRPIQTWEFFDRPDMNNTYLTFFRGTPQEYATLLNATHLALHRACKECRLLHSPIQGITAVSNAYWHSMYIQTDAFDIINLQSHRGEQDYGIGAYRATFPTMSKPLWISMVAFNTNKENVTESLPFSTAAAFAAGAEVVFLGDDTLYNDANALSAANRLMELADGFEKVEKINDDHYIFTMKNLTVHLVKDISAFIGKYPGDVLALSKNEEASGMHSAGYIISK